MGVHSSLNEVSEDLSKLAIQTISLCVLHVQIIQSTVLSSIHPQIHSVHEWQSQEKPQVVAEAASAGSNQPSSVIFVWLTRGWSAKRGELHDRARFVSLLTSPSCSVFLFAIPANRLISKVT